MAVAARGFEVKIKFGLSAGVAGGTPSLRPYGDADRAIVIAPLLLLVLILGGCGNPVSTTSNPIAESDPSSGDRAGGTAPDTGVGSGTGPADPDASSGAEAGADTGSGADEIGADVLLVEPAGRVELPESQTPNLKFKALEAEAITTQRTGGAASRIALTSDGGRSTSAATGSGSTTGNVTISWDPPSENADGSSLNDLAGYRVYQGNTDQLSIVQEINETGAGERRLTQVSNVSPANACFAVTAFDTSANESSLGDVVCKETIVAAPPVNNQAPNLSAVTQLSSSDGLAEIQLTWQPPATSGAGAGAVLELYSVYHGSQSQLFKIQEVSEASTVSGSQRRHVVPGIGGEQACFALTASYSDGTESSLGEIVCVARQR